MSNHQKVALITGAARRIGAEIARILHEAGYNVLVHYRHSKKEAEALCERLNAMRPFSAKAMQFDLLDIQNLPNLVKDSFQVWGRIDVLVNNAARFYKTSLGQINEMEWQDLMTSNLAAPLFLSQAASPYLRQSQGVIINITDIHGQDALREYSVYSASKAGLIMLTKTLAKELAPAIRVNAVSPAGGVLWPENENILSHSDKEKIIQKTALKRAGSPKDIAHAVLFLVQDASYMTGQIVRVDGGRVF